MEKKLRLLSTESVKDKELFFTESNNSFEIKEVEYQDTDITEASGEQKKALKVTIKAIHAGRTGNEHIFKADKIKGSEELKSGVISFTHPYCKPMLTHHNTVSEPVGRIVNSYYSEEEGGMAIIEVIVSDTDAIEKVKDGRYNTVSIGARTNYAKCNICGTNILEDWCGHQRGKEYDGVVCGWELGDLWFYECSFVNVPADENAQVLQWNEVEYEPYNMTQEETQSEEVVQEGMTIAASDEKTTAVSEEHQIEEGDTEDEQEKPETEEEPKAEEPETEDNEEVTPEETHATQECVTFDNTDIAESAIATLKDDVDFVGEVKEAISSMKEDIANMVKKEVSETVENLILQNKKKDEEIQQGYQTILSSTQTIERAFTALKEFYNKLRTYSDQESVEYNDAWSLEEQVDEINKLFKQIDAEIELGTDYAVEHGDGLQTVEINEKPVVKDSIEKDVYGLMTKKKF